MQVSIHLASQEERLIAHQHSYQSWSLGRNLEEYINRCTSSLRHNRADWWVLCESGSVVSSLALYPLRFWSYGEQYRGFGIGSVFTHHDFRGRGYAFDLCTKVMKVEQEKGASAGLLFTDVSPDYYGKMGFKLCDDHNYECHDIMGLAQKTRNIQLVDLNPEELLDRLVKSHEIYHRDGALRIARDRDYWRTNLVYLADQQFLSICDSSGNYLGYLRFYQDKDCLVPTEIVLPSEVEGEVFAALAERTVQGGVKRFYSWLRPPEEVMTHFNTKQRSKARPMVWLGHTHDISHELLPDIRFYGTDYF